MLCERVASYRIWRFAIELFASEFREVTITRVGTNNKYSSGWDLAFGKGKSKKSAGTATVAKPAAKPAKSTAKATKTVAAKSTAKTTAAKPVAAKATAAKATATKARAKKSK